MSSDVEVLPAAPAAASRTVRPQPDPAADIEAIFAEMLAGVLDAESVPVDDHFFDDLGADSLVMARFCARVRKRPELPPVSMKDIYQHSTVTALAAALAPARAESQSQPGSGSGSEPQSEPQPRPEPEFDEAPRGSTVRYLLCGLAQFLIMVGYTYPFALVTVSGYEWISTSAGPLQTYLRSVVFGAVSFVGLCLLPVLAKWLLIGRWKPQRFPVWSLRYLRFWFVKLLVRSSPMAFFVGTPLYLVYLRALGAKIGRGAVLLSPGAVCTDLFSVGENTVVRKDSLISGYRAHAGVIEIGAVRLGRDVLVGEATVLDIGTSMGDGAQLGHASSLHTGQSVPAGEHWHGSPAARTGLDYRRVGPVHRSGPRRFTYSVAQLAWLFAFWVPLGLGGLTLLLTAVPQLAVLVTPGPLSFTTWTFYRDGLIVATVLFLGAIVVGLLLVAIVPRVLNLALKPDRDYPLYGLRYWAHRTIARRTNVKFFLSLFGDSSYITGYLRWVGYDLGQVEQTGSNFGSQVKHENPFLTSIGTGTMVADGLSLLNADYSSTSFRLSRVTVGSRSFLGNNIVYPAGGRTGDNCLLGTKVMVPLDGPVREGVGLLGSPSFEIPRSVERDALLAPADAGQQRHRLRAKNRHNRGTIARHLLVRWFFVFLTTVSAWVSVDLYASLGTLSVMLFGTLTMIIGVTYWILVDRCVTRLQTLAPEGCSIYDKDFWRHERFWKVPAQTYMMAFNGTPMKNLIWRCLGVRIGRRVFDDGAHFSERTFVTIGDDCTLNARSGVQCHSQEDGAFKSDRSVLGAGVTLGVGAFVHYGVEIGDHVALGPDTFVMKGEEVPRAGRWCGNPALDERSVQRTLVAATAAARPAIRAAVSVGGPVGGPVGRPAGVLPGPLLPPTPPRTRSAVEQWQAIPVPPRPLSSDDPDLAMAYRNLAHLVNRSAAMEAKLDAYARQAARAGRRGAAVALLATACVVVLTAGTLIGSGAVPQSWRLLVGLSPVAAAAGGKPGASDNPGGEAGARDDPGAEAGAQGAEQPQAEFVDEFFAMLPGDLSGAYAELTPEFQRELGGLAGFTRLYRDVASVRLVGEPVVVDADTVTATIRVQRKGGLAGDERYEYTVVEGAEGELQLTGWKALP
ncbi:MAG: Pls/PosA family non-ribosomal peptide synthetase [Pseudonocardia sp.]